MARAWLFGVCVVLCLMLGDALKCLKCEVKNLKEIKNKCKTTCEVNGNRVACIVYDTYEDQKRTKLVRRRLACTDNYVDCRPTGLGFGMHRCCDDKDFCTNSFKSLGDYVKKGIEMPGFGWRN